MNATLINYLFLENKILTTPEERYCSIYKITNIITNKLYIGQAVSHILNHNKYRPYGHLGRFKSHISEAFSNKKKQSLLLNNSIRKHGINNFNIELLEYCEIENADERELYFIQNFKTLYPYGYNLKLGGKQFIHTLDSKKTVSAGVVKYFQDKKYERFKHIHHIDDDVNKYIRPLRRNKAQYGWYVYINNIKADFGGVHLSLEDSFNNALHFIKTLKENLVAKHLGAGNPLEPLTTTSLLET